MSMQAQVADPVIKNISDWYGQINLKNKTKQQSTYTCSGINYFIFHLTQNKHVSRYMRFPTMWYVRPAKPQISLRIRAV